MVEAVLGNRLIAPDAETRIWKDADKFAHGEFVENVRLGSGIYPTLVRISNFYLTVNLAIASMFLIFSGQREPLLRSQHVPAQLAKHERGHRQPSDRGRRAVVRHLWRAVLPHEDGRPQSLRQGQFDGLKHCPSRSIRLARTSSITP